ncbi:MAG: dTDP-4-dehydrorhamnose 3,5-epimerase family protein [Puniceicoccaceae bacterium]
MKILSADTSIQGSLVIQLDKHRDHRGAFQALWEREQFEALNVDFSPDNVYHSFNTKRDTLRGLHFQSEPYQQAKLVTCISGRVMDVAVDLCKTSPTYLQVSMVELVAGECIAHWVPNTCAHGFWTLEASSTVSYVIEGAYRPEYAHSLRWNDPDLQIAWPHEHPILSEKDANAPLLREL